MSTSKDYPGQKILISYLSNRNNKSSYQGFLNLHRNDIIALSSSSSNWKKSDDLWALNFLKEAEKNLNKSIFNTLKEKVKSERLKQWVKPYWQEVIKECKKKENVATYPKDKDLSKVSQPYKNSKKNIKLFCYEVLCELKNRLYSYPFYDCIDTEKLDYFKVIKNPMDLSTINSKLENDHYTIAEEFEEDIRLIFHNCYAYNDVGSEIYYLGKALESVFNKKWIEKPTFQDLKRARYDVNTYSLSEFRKKQKRILNQNKNELQMINDVTSIYNNLITSNKEKLETGNPKVKNKNINTDSLSTGNLITSNKGKLETGYPKVRNKNINTDNLSTEFKAKHKRVLKPNEMQVVNEALLVASACNNLTEQANVFPFVNILKAFLLTRSRMSLSSTNEPVLQAIVESLLPLSHRIPELSLVVNGERKKGLGRFGYSDIFILKGSGNNNISLELKYISLIGLVEEKLGANELEKLDKILEKENEELLLKRQYTYRSKDKKMNQTTIGEILTNGIIQLNLYLNIISKGKAIDYSSSGVFDERIRITKSDPNILKGFVILVIGFRRILWRSVEDVTSNYTYNKI